MTNMYLVIVERMSKNFDPKICSKHILTFANF